MKNINIQPFSGPSYREDLQSFNIHFTFSFYMHVYTWIFTEAFWVKCLAQGSNSNAGLRVLHRSSSPGLASLAQSFRGGWEMYHFANRIAHHKPVYFAKFIFFERETGGRILPRPRSVARNHW